MNIKAKQYPTLSVLAILNKCSELTQTNITFSSRSTQRSAGRHKWHCDGRHVRKVNTDTGIQNSVTL